MAAAGAVQTEIVASLGALGARAIGLSGVDGQLVLARRKEGARAVVEGRVVRVTGDWSGSIERVDADLLRSLLHLGVLPVLGPPAVTSRGEIVNVDADRIAAETAVALAADALVLLTNVPGLLRRRDDPASLIPAVGRGAMDEVLSFAEGRMRKKVLAARTALSGGVTRVVIAPSQGARPIATALEGRGTVFA